MGLCFSKKKPPAAKPGKIATAVVSDDKAKKPAPQPPKRAAGDAAAANKAAVFVVRPGSSAKDASAAAPGEDPRKKKRSGSQEPAPKQLPVVLVPSAPVRTSSCTKEEVDAILIQCGRLSRSSSGAGRTGSSSAETGGGGGGGGGHRRRRSGSKRSCDFDQEARADEECDWERQGAAAVSRPSPHRGSPQRKRSGSRERSGGGTGTGSRRASRSPGRRADSAAASVATAGSAGGDRARQPHQPGKMVSVPAREKGRAPSPAAASGKRCASPRSSSPARMAAAGNENAGGGPAAGPTLTPALSRSSSRRNEQSPYRRSPMAELDENSLRNNSSHSAKPQKKSNETSVAATPKKPTGRGKELAAVPSSCSGKERPEIAEDAAVSVAASETRAHSSKTNATARMVSIVAESLTQRPAAAQPGCRSRRASRDFDQNPAGSYTTQLLEDIHNYHQQSTSATPATPSFSLPACVAKACSIVEAVADLNSSSSSENRTYEYEPGGQSADDKGSVNDPAGGSDDIVEPSAARKHHPLPVRADVRAETEPQESAGSNSVSGHPWTPSWEPTSVESTERTWSTGDEVVEQSGSHGGRGSPMNRPRQSKQRQSQPEPSGWSRAGSGNGNGQYRGRSSAHRGSGSAASGRSGVRVVSAN